MEHLEIQGYDVIITDVFMPGLSDLDLLRLIKKRELPTPVIAISARGDEFQALLKAMGAFECLTKPMHLETLELAITRAFAQPDKPLGI